MNRTLLIEDEAWGFSLTITEDCAELRDLLEGVESDALDAAAGKAEDDLREARDEGADEANLEVLGPGRDWLELSAAIARGDTIEAAFLLDRIAERLGTEAVEQVQRGRYSQSGKPGRAA